MSGLRLYRVEVFQPEFDAPCVWLVGAATPKLALGLLAQTRARGCDREMAVDLVRAVVSKAAGAPKHDVYIERVRAPWLAAATPGVLEVGP